MTRTVRPRTCVFLLLLGLLAPPAFARGGELSGPVEERGVFSWLRKALGELVVPALGQSRGTMDPDGALVTAPPPPSLTGETDSRGTMDPDGHT
jgi:hypothetical protein